MDGLLGALLDSVESSRVESCPVRFCPVLSGPVLLMSEVEYVWVK
jgi:hypothetical protein